MNVKDDEEQLKNPVHTFSSIDRWNSQYGALFDELIRIIDQMERSQEEFRQVFRDLRHTDLAVELQSTIKRYEAANNLVLGAIRNNLNLIRLNTKECKRFCYNQYFDKEWAE